jgi:hypothetical protein
VSGGSVTVKANTLHFGTGGAGGDGGEGGKGGKRGYGGQPGTGAASAGDGGWGGQGGKGGRGGHGGGGGGGPSVGIFLANGASPVCEANAFVGKNKPGTGGKSKGEAGAEGLGMSIGPDGVEACNTDK